MILFKLFKTVQSYEKKSEIKHERVGKFAQEAKKLSGFLYSGRIQVVFRLYTKSILAEYKLYSG